MYNKSTMADPVFKLELQDTQWELEYIDHDRLIARAIVFDAAGYYYFVRAVRDDDFGKATLIETAGGGVESFHLSTLKLTYEEAVREYEKCAATRLGRLVANRELPILRRAKEIADKSLRRR